MRIEWYGQSAFTIEADGTTVAIDPFGDVSGRVRFDYPPIDGLRADLLLVTHEHRDHNAVEVVGGDPTVIRSTAGTFAGDVIGIASEHDTVAGTLRGANVIYAFTLGGLRVAHFGDFGQAALRPEQRAALGAVDLLFIPVGDGPTIGAALAHEIAGAVGARWVVPMHYRTPRVNFLEPADEFLARFAHVTHVESAFELAAVPEGAVVPAAP